MKTKEMIQLEYDSQVERINNEINVVIELLNKEEEIIKLLCSHAKGEIFKFSQYKNINIILSIAQDGGVSFFVNRLWTFESGFSLITQDEKGVFKNVLSKEGIKRGLHLSFLKRIHPKTYIEHYRRFAKDFFL